MGPSEVSGRVGKNRKKWGSSFKQLFGYIIIMSVISCYLFLFLGLLGGS